MITTKAIADRVSLFVQRAFIPAFHRFPYLPFRPTVARIKKTAIKHHSTTASTKSKSAKQPTATKFKIRCSSFLYTLVLYDQEKAEKLKQSLPPGEFSARLCVHRRRTSGRRDRERLDGTYARGHMRGG